LGQTAIPIPDVDLNVKAVLTSDLYRRRFLATRWPPNSSFSGEVEPIDARHTDLPPKIRTLTVR